MNYKLYSLGIVFITLLGCHIIRAHTKKYEVPTILLKDTSLLGKTNGMTILKLYQMMKDVHELFVKNEIPYWIDSGTLIGAERHQGIITWDEDLDICVDKTDEQRLLTIKPLFEQLGYGMIEMFFGYKIYPKDGIVRPRLLFKYPSLDIFITQEVNDKIYYEREKAKSMRRKRTTYNMHIKKEELYPLKEYKFGAIVVNGPHNARPYLNAYYGDDWFDVAYRDYDYFNEVPLKNKLKAFLTDKDRVPAQPLGPLQDRVTTLFNTSQ